MLAPPCRLFALVDCSAFYCSCERAFDPSLERRPVAVLSNNDGCVIAATPEVKAAGVKTGEPFFKCQHELEAVGAAVFSSNYTLYADVSRRVMETLRTFIDDVEVYSIDEAFLALPVREGVVLEEERVRFEALTVQIHERVLKWTGIPVRVSVAETKTLAKAASVLAKARMREGQEPCVVMWGAPGSESMSEREAFLERLPVREVWGIASRWGARLEALGAPTASAFAHMPDRLIRKELNVVGLRTAYELRGVSCLPIEQAPPPRKSLVRSRSFGEPITSFGPLREAVATHVARAAEKLRREGLAAGCLQVFVTTKGHGAGPHKTCAAACGLGHPTDRTPELIRAAVRLLASCYEEADWRRPYRYRKAGVMLTALAKAEPEQGRLFVAPDPQAARLMEAVDAINRRFGSRAVVFGAMGVPQRLAAVDDAEGERPVWGMRRERMSPRYTTRWDELVEVRA